MITHVLLSINASFLQPLDVDKGIELPQLELISTKNDDCTTEYSTGKFVSTEVLYIYSTSRLNGHFA